MTRVLEGKRIFLVEDDVMNLAVFSNSLAKTGAIIEQDVFGYGIVKHIEVSCPIDLIILDIMLRRGVNGYDVFDEIKKHPFLSRIPVIVVTSLDPEVEIPKAKEKGVNGFIAKPISALEFPRHVADVINGKEVWIAG